MILQKRQSAIVSSRAPGHGRPRDALEVAPQIQQREAGGLPDQLLDLIVLSVAEFEDQKAAGAKPCGRLRHETGDEMEPVGSPEERDVWLVVADLRLEPAPIAFRHVRRVARHQIERTAEAVEEVGAL